MSDQMQEVREEGWKDGQRYKTLLSGWGMKIGARAFWSMEAGRNGGSEKWACLKELYEKPYEELIALCDKYPNLTDREGIEEQKRLFDAQHERIMDRVKEQEVEVAAV